MRSVTNFLIEVYGLSEKITIEEELFIKLCLQFLQSSNDPQYNFDNETDVT